MNSLLVNLMSREEFVSLTVSHKGPLLLKVADGPDALLDLKRDVTIQDALSDCTMQEINADGWSGPEIWVHSLSTMQSISHRCLGFICGDIERVLHLMGTPFLKAQHCESTEVDGHYHLYGLEGYQDPELPADRLIFVGAPLVSNHPTFADMALLYNL